MKLIKVAMAIILTFVIMSSTACSDNILDNNQKPTERPIPTNRPRGDKKYYNTIENDKPSTFNLFPEEYNELIPLALNPTASVSMQFYAVTDFNKLSVSCPSYGNNIGALKMSIYKWNINIDMTLTGDVLRESVFENFEDNSTIEFLFETLPEGEYLLDIIGIEEVTGVWVHDNNLFGTRVYYNGIVQAGSLSATISYIHTPDVSVAPLSDNIEYELQFIKAPNEKNISNNISVLPDTWDAYDSISRSMPSSVTANIKEDKKREVGILYYTRPKVKNAKRNLTTLLERFPEAQENPDHGIWNSYSTLYWNEPLYGFYNGDNKYIYRKHAEMLADAGVDVIFINISDGLYKELYESLFETWMQARKDGVNTPQIAFLTDYNNIQNGVYQLKSLFKDLYKPEKYHELWFYLDGRPLVLCNNELLNSSVHNDQQLLKYFTFRKIDSDYFKDTTKKGIWGIQSVYPQTRNSFDKSGNTEQMTVSPAQNVNAEGLTTMNGNGVYGRSFGRFNYSYSYKFNGKETLVNNNILNSKLYGLNFQQQWDYAIYVDPDMVIVNGWNEGVVKRYNDWNGIQNAIFNQYNDEYSTDIEPSKGELKDNYYYQLVANIRRFKGVNSLDYSSALKTIDITKGSDDWNSVNLTYNHYVSNIQDGNIRNDIVSAKVAYDRNYIYFLVETKDDITPYTDASWMRLYIDTEESNESWENYEYVINRLNPTDTVCYLEKSLSGWNWETVGELKYSVKGNKLQIEIPRHMLGIKSGWFSGMPSFNFKWADNVQNDGDINEFYIGGDVAPGGRFSFRFNTY